MTAYVMVGVASSFDVTLSPVADASTVRWSLLDNSGLPITAATNVAVANAPASALVTIAVPAALHGLATGATENRFLFMSWMSGGHPQSKYLPYVVRPFLPIQVQPADVLSITGLNSAEIAETEIDIQSAAMLVQADVTPPLFMGFLLAGDVATALVNQLVALRAAIELTPSIELRVAQMMKTDTASYQRFDGFEAKKFIAGLWDCYARVRGDLVGEVIVQPFLFGTATRAPDKFLKVFALGYNTGNGFTNADGSYVNISQFFIDGGWIAGT